MRNKRSQTATEYLIILAVVIVISLIVVGVLGGIPSIGGGTSNSANDAKLKTGKVAIISYSVTNEGTKVVIRNNQADTVKVSALNINGTACSSSDLPTILPAGISKEILCTNINSSIREDVFEFPLIINYTDTKTNSDYVLDDDLKLIGRVGHKTVVIWAESILSTVEINDSTQNGPIADYAGDCYGQSGANLGDLDGDGVIDLVVGAATDDAGGLNRGAIHIHFMNSDGSVKSTVEINDTTANGSILENLDNYGTSIANLGDLDGDGVIDLAVGASGNGGGALFIHFINSDGSIKSTIEINSSTPNGPILNNSDFYGISMAALGDLDGDGVNDLAVGAKGDDAGGTGRGAVHIHFMNSDGSVNLTKEINSDTQNGPNLENWDSYGASVANLGDLDGDGVIDLGVGAENDGTARGVVYIHFMNSDGGIKSTAEINSSVQNGPTLDDFDYFGTSIASLGDLNGDGLVDIGVGAPGDGAGGALRGTMHIFYLTAGGNIKSSLEINALTENGPIMPTDAGYGASIINLGDLDRNGFNDFAVGSAYAEFHIHFLNSTLW